MLKQESRPQAAPVETTTELWAFFRGEFVPLRDANINVMTHGFNYGTAVFEGIRAYWNAEEEQLFGLELVPHYKRIHASARLLMMEVRQSPEELAEITVELLRRDGLREDVYIRPIVYKSSETIGVRLHNLDADITIFGVPFGQYIDTEGGIRAQVSTWRRTDDNAIPARGKITGAYVNGALAKSEAQLNGFDEAIVLTADGHVSEGSAENLFIVKDGVAHHAAGHRQHPGGHHPRAPHRDGPRRSRRRRSSSAIDRPDRAVRGRRGLPVRHRRPDQPGDRDRPSARSAPVGPARSPASCRAPTSTRCAGACPPTATGSPPSTRRPARRIGIGAQPAARLAGASMTTSETRDRYGWLGRLLEMVPGTISWAVLILPIWLSFSYPWLVALLRPHASTSTGSAARSGSAAR